MTSRTIPNLFLIGAPKSGTTSLAYYMSQHPSIFVAPTKEPHFFCPEFTPRFVRNGNAYASLFGGARDQHRWVAEASTLYMYFQESIARIVAYNPDARFIAMLRDPLKMVPSWYAHLCASPNILEDCKTLDEAWSLVESRKRGERIPNGCQVPPLLFYDEIAKYHKQLQMLWQCVHRNRIHVIIFEKFHEDPRESFSELCDFLEIPRCPTIRFAVKNARKAWRSETFRSVVSNPIVPRLRDALYSIGLWDVVRSLKPLVYRDQQTVPVSRRIQEEICACYREDVSALRTLLALPLEGWLKTDSQ